MISPHIPEKGEYVLSGQRAGSAEFGTVGRTWGEKKHTLRAAEIPELAVDMKAPDGSWLTTIAVDQSTAPGSNPNRNTLAAGSPSAYKHLATHGTNGEAHNVIQPTRAALAIIKT